MNKDGEIQALVLVREDEFYCYEQQEHPPQNMKELMGRYAACEIVELEMKAPEASPAPKKPSKAKGRKRTAK